MQDDRPGFYWRDRESHAATDKRGLFIFDELQPFLELVATLPANYLLVCLPNVNLDFTATLGEIEMEIYDDHGMHIAIVSLKQAEEVSRRAVRSWNAPVLRGQLTDLNLHWLCTSHHYA